MQKGEKLKIRLGNRTRRIQHASIMLKRLVPHFYPRMHLDDYWRPLFRNPSSLISIRASLVVQTRMVLLLLGFEI